MPMISTLAKLVQRSPPVRSETGLAGVGDDRRGVGITLIDQGERGAFPAFGWIALEGEEDGRGGRPSFPTRCSQPLFSRRRGKCDEPVPTDSGRNPPTLSPEEPYRAEGMQRNSSAKGSTSRTRGRARGCSSGTGRSRRGGRRCTTPIGPHAPRAREGRGTGSFLSRSDRTGPVAGARRASRVSPQVPAQRYRGPGNPPYGR